MCLHLRGVSQLFDSIVFNEHSRRRQYIAAARIQQPRGSHHGEGSRGLSHDLADRQ